MPSDERYTRTLGPHLALTPGAGVMLDLLEDLGHLDGAAVGALADAITDAPEAYGVAVPPGAVDREALRRAAAVVLFELPPEQDPEQASLLKKEWRLLFS